MAIARCFQLRPVLTTFALALATTHCGDDATTGGGGGATSSSSIATVTGASAGKSTASAGTTGAGGDGSGAGWPMPIPNYCDLCALSDGSPVANLEIDEASGIAASAVHDGVFYVNNDSGDLARFFAVGGDGTDQGTFTLEAATHDDFEDIALGPCSVGHCVYVADIGDNDEVRTFYTVYRVPEPAMVGAGPQTVFPTQLKFKYPDGSHNAEALIIHPITGEVALIQKVPAGQAAGIYKAPEPWPANTIVTLTREGELDPADQSPTVTSADVHPLGHGILVRTFDGILYFAANGPEEPIAETLGRTPCVMPSPTEPQGEAIAWTRAGDGYVTVSEGTGAPVNHVTCSKEETSP